MQLFSLISSFVYVGMVDYQHVLPVHADVARRKEKRCSEAKGPFGNVVSFLRNYYISILSL